jgi:hypothetical protein
MNFTVAERSGTKKGWTYNADWVKQALLHEGLFDAVLITFPPAPVAVAYRRPRPVDARATAAEQQVVVQLISLRRRPAVNPVCGRAFDGEHNSAVIVCRENVPSKAVVVWFPPNRRVLRDMHVYISTQTSEGNKI